jgi:hypothetical protein
MLSARRIMSSSGQSAFTTPTLVKPLIKKLSMAWHAFSRAPRSRGTNA